MENEGSQCYSPTDSWSVDTWVHSPNHTPQTLDSIQGLQGYAGNKYEQGISVHVSTSGLSCLVPQIFHPIFNLQQEILKVSVHSCSKSEQENSPDVSFYLPNTPEIHQIVLGRQAWPTWGAQPGSGCGLLVPLS